MLRTMRMVAVLATCAAAASCAGRANGSAEGGWDVEGVIAAVDPGPAATRVTVETADAEDPGRAILLVEPGTEIVVEEPDGTSRAGSAADLRVGARIQARHTGAELRSLPPQYVATRVRVLLGP